jgi:hypothetical protein
MLPLPLFETLIEGVNLQAVLSGFILTFPPARGVSLFLTIKVEGF